MVYTIFMNDCIAVFVHRSVLDLRISMTMSYVLFFSFLFAHGQLYTLLECLNAFYRDLNLMTLWEQRVPSLCSLRHGLTSPCSPTLRVIDPFSICHIVVESFSDLALLLQSQELYL
jgi:hypothetical protein